jgi:pyruvate ferredoxin oxidoreductase alpha subunit
VIDQNISPGLGGILYQEVAAVLANVADRPKVVRSFIGGLGGKDISTVEFDRVLKTLEDTEPGEQSLQPELLFTAGEWQQVKKVLAVAGKPVEGSMP